MHYQFECPRCEAFSKIDTPPWSATPEYVVCSCGAELLVCDSIETLIVEERIGDAHGRKE